MLFEYAVFVLLILAAVICYIAHEMKPKEVSSPMDDPRDKTESPIERRLYDALKFRGEFIKTQVPCGKYRIDIALPAYRIAIECDGKAHHSSPEQKARDKRKNAYLKENGWKVLRFSGKRINGNLSEVLKRIEREMKDTEVFQTKSLN